MILITTWKSRPLNPEQFNRLMNVWGKLEQKTAADSSTERICWYSYSDGTGGLTIDKVADVEAASGARTRAVAQPRRVHRTRHQDRHRPRCGAAPDHQGAGERQRLIRRDRWARSPGEVSGRSRPGVCGSRGGTAAVVGRPVVTAGPCGRHVARPLLPSPPCPPEPSSSTSTTRSSSRCPTPWPRSARRSAPCPASTRWPTSRPRSRPSARCGRRGRRLRAVRGARLRLVGGAVVDLRGQPPLGGRPGRLGAHLPGRGVASGGRRSSASTTPTLLAARPPSASRTPSAGATRSSRACTMPSPRSAPATRWA